MYVYICIYVYIYMYIDGKSTMWSSDHLFAALQLRTSTTTNAEELKSFVIIRFVFFYVYSSIYMYAYISIHVYVYISIY
jgi:hypothetical protein